MPPPTRGTVVQSSPNWTTGSVVTRTATTFGISVGDLLVLMGMSEDEAFGNIGLPTTSNGSTTSWSNGNLLEKGTANQSCGGHVWYATATSAGTITVSVPGPSTGLWGFKLVQISGWTAVGDFGSKFPTSTNTDEMDTSSGTNYTLDSLITAKANSLIEFMVGDYSANITLPAAGERQEADAGTMTYEQYVVGNGSNYGVFGGYYADSGAAGLKIVGFSTIRKPTMLALEIQGTNPPPPPTPVRNVGSFDREINQASWYG